jgi:uncharacterized membrane protein YeaQ/YmgE (transglycosylase-associated protein family)
VENPISGQILQAASTLLVGLALGLVYDLFRAVRMRTGTLAGVVCDVSFCVVTAAALFLLGMGPGRGELRLYMMAVAFIGAMAYFALFGRYVRRYTARFFALMGKAVAILCIPMAKLRMVFKKFSQISKNIFSSAQKRFTISDNIVFGAENAQADSGPGTDAHSEAFSYETKEIQHIYQNSDFGACSVRSYQPCHDEREDNPSAGRSGRAAKAGGRNPAKKCRAGVRHRARR